MTGLVGKNLRIHASKDKPKQAVVAVKHRAIGFMSMKPICIPNCFTMLSEHSGLSALLQSRSLFIIFRRLIEQ
jgi:hypothetical protein